MLNSGKFYQENKPLKRQRTYLGIIQRNYQATPQKDSISTRTLGRSVSKDMQILVMNITWQERQLVQTP